MIEYPKIETLFDRDEKTHKVIEGAWRRPLFPTISLWDVTEKIDGTNVRVMLNANGDVRYGGRTDNASMPTKLLAVLQTILPAAELKEALWKDGQCDACLYGEGYGATIQKGGGNYRRDVSFRLFDVRIGQWWLDWKDVEDVAVKLGILTAPYRGQWNLETIVRAVKDGFFSSVADDENPLAHDQPVKAEGVVARPVEPIFGKRGERIIVKLKTKDF